MKSLVFICLLFCLSCNEETPKSIKNYSPGLQINAIVSGFYHGTSQNCVFDYHLIDLKATNSGDTNIKLWVYSCGIIYNFLLSDSAFTILYNNCDANYPELIELKPKQSLVVPIMIKHSDTAKLSYWPGFKIGFVLVPENQYHFELNLLEKIEYFKKSGIQVIWSNEIDLFHDIKKSYEIY